MWNYGNNEEHEAGPGWPGFGFQQHAAPAAPAAMPQPQVWPAHQLQPQMFQMERTQERCLDTGMHNLLRGVEAMAAVGEILQERSRSPYLLAQHGSAGPWHPAMGMPMRMGVPMRMGRYTGAQPHWLPTLGAPAAVPTLGQPAVTPSFMRPRNPEIYRWEVDRRYGCMCAIPWCMFVAACLWA